MDVKASLFAAFKTTDELQAILAQRAANTERILILGGGSNILFCNDFDGLVLKNEI